MLRGMAEDFSFSDTRFVYIASLDEGDDPRREELWIKANPNLGVSLTLESLRTQAAELESDPQSIFDFQRFHANIWNSVVRGHSLPYDAIEACVGVPWTGTAMALREAFLKESDQLHADLPFFGGFDLGLSDDLAALVLITRADLGDLVGEGPTEVKTVIVPYFWISEAKIPEREKSLRVPLRLWVREGWIRIAGHGDMVDLDIVEKDLLKIFERHRIREIGYDPWKADRFFGSLVDRGFVKAMAVKQLPSFLTIPSRELKSGIIKGTFAHLGNPVYKWMCAGVDLEPSETTGGIKPAKSDGDRRNKIDAISATVCGLQRMYAPEWKNVFRDFSDFKFTTV